MNMSHNFETAPHPRSVALKNFLKWVKAQTAEGVGNLDPVAIMKMDDDDQQQLMDKITRYLMFEFSEDKETLSMPILATGYGMLFASDFNGNVLGVEKISDGDIVTGTILDVCALPVPTTESLDLQNTDGTFPVFGQTISGILTLTDAVYRTGLNEAGIFKEEHAFSGAQVSIPLSYRLDIDYYPGTE